MYWRRESTQNDKFSCCDANSLACHPRASVLAACPHGTLAGAPGVVSGGDLQAYRALIPLVHRATAIGEVTRGCHRHGVRPYQPTYTATCAAGPSARRPRGRNWRAGGLDNPSLATVRGGRPLLCYTTPRDVTHDADG